MVKYRKVGRVIDMAISEPAADFKIGARSTAFCKSLFAFDALMRKFRGRIVGIKKTF